MRERCLPVWTDIKRDLEQGKSVLVVAHTASIRALAQAIDSLSDADAARLTVTPCAPLVFRFERHHGRLLPVRPEVAAAVAAQEATGQPRLSALPLAPSSLSHCSERGTLPAHSMIRVPDSLGPATGMPAKSRLAQDKGRMATVVIIRHGKTDNNILGRFTGWDDVGLAREGREEARRAGQMLRKHNLVFDVVHTSWLTRAIQTAWHVLSEMDCLWLPVKKTWRLNERMYGALTGRSKRATRAQYGEAQFKAWRRGYDAKPPRVSSFSKYYPGNDRRYTENVVDVRPSFRETLIRSLERGRLSVHRNFPRTESLKDCMRRTIPYWEETILPDARAGKSVLVASSENAIRGMLMHVLDISPEKIVEIEVPTGLPMVVDFDQACLRLLEGKPSDYNLARAAPCSSPRTRRGAGTLLVVECSNDGRSNERVCRWRVCGLPPCRG